MLTAKSLICISLILAFAMALQERNETTLNTHGSLQDAQHQYLDAGTADGSIGIAANINNVLATGRFLGGAEATEPLDHVMTEAVDGAVDDLPVVRSLICARDLTGDVAGAEDNVAGARLLRRCL